MKLDTLGRPIRVAKKKPVLERAVSKIKVDEHGCWLWLGGKSGSGYGLIGAGGRNAPRHSLYVHRVMYEAHVGPIPDGLDLDHLCRVRACVNPAHLESVTRSENLKRSPVIGAYQKAITHCPRGHAYEGENLYVKKNGNRQCRECNRERCRAQRARAKIGDEVRA